jgi:hypothetical protein
MTFVSLQAVRALAVGRPWLRGAVFGTGAAQLLIVPSRQLIEPWAWLWTVPTA